MTAPEGSPSADTPESRLTNAEVAAAVGLSERDTRRFWRALGLPDAGDEARYGEVDVRVLHRLTQALEQTGVDLDTGIRLVRAVGQNIARMTDWQVAAVASQVAAVDGARSKATLALADRLGGGLEDVLLYAWHRHLTAAAGRLDAHDQHEDAELAETVTVGFADLVSFSALSNELDPDRLGELVEIFESRCADVVAAADGRVVKTLGDSVLFVVAQPDAAMDIAAGIVEVIGRDARLPDVRLGLATGTVITRLGDVFGPPVNLAARLTALARRNRVLADEATVEGLQADRYDLLRLTARPVRGFGLVEPIAVRRR